MFVLRKAIEFALVLGVFICGCASADAAAVSPQALFATEHSAVGGAAWNDIAAIRSSGTIIAGGARGTFTQIIDHQNGYSRSSLTPARSMTSPDSTEPLGTSKTEL